MKIFAVAEKVAPEDRRIPPLIWTPANPQPVVSRVNAQQREITFEPVNTGVIHPTLFKCTVTTTVIVVVSFV